MPQRLIGIQIFYQHILDRHIFDSLERLPNKVGHISDYLSGHGLEQAFTHPYTHTHSDFLQIYSFHTINFLDAHIFSPLSLSNTLVMHTNTCHTHTTTHNLSHTHKDVTYTHLSDTQMGHTHTLVTHTKCHIYTLFRPTNGSHTHL